MSNLSEVLNNYKDKKINKDLLKFYISRLIPMTCPYCHKDYELEDIEFTEGGYTSVCKNYSCNLEKEKINSLVRDFRNGGMSVERFISKSS